MADVWSNDPDRTTRRGDTRTDAEVTRMLYVSGVPCCGARADGHTIMCANYRGTDPNPLVASGEYVRVYAGEVYSGDVLATGGRVLRVTSAPGERVRVETDRYGVMTYSRTSTVLIKA